MTLLGQPAHRLTLGRQLADMFVTATENGRQQTGNLGGDHQQQAVAGGLFQGFEQGVGGRLRHALRIGNNHHLAATKLGRILQARTDLANGLDPDGLALRRQGAQIRMMALLKQLAGVTLATGLTPFGPMAEVQARQLFRKLLLAKTGIA